VNSTRLTPQLSEADQDARLKSLLDAAHKADLAGDVDAAELRFKEAIDSANDLFGPHSWQLATVLFHAAAFYSANHRDCSARECFERMRKVMRW
jgi:hypothetical protein